MSEINGVDEGSVAAGGDPRVEEASQEATRALPELISATLQHGLPHPPPDALVEPPMPPPCPPPPMRLSPAPSLMTVDQGLDDEDDASSIVPYSRLTCRAVASQSLHDMIEH